MTAKLENVRTVLDALRGAGLSEYDISRALALHEVHSNPRSVRHWFSGKTRCRTVEYRALCDLLNEVTNEPNT